MKRLSSSFTNLRIGFALLRVSCSLWEARHQMCSGGDSLDQRHIFAISAGYRDRLGDHDNRWSIVDRA
ncbi:hypothetical protein KC340_g60 [Hortaea werneckii]|nr:hypothetical protein KC340_g60 [Hortaea werneckii]